MTRKNANAAKPATRKPRVKKSDDPFAGMTTVPFSVVKVAYANAKGVDDITASSKTLRNGCRSNFDHLRKTFGWPQEGKDNRDGNRYDAVPVDLAREFAKGIIPSAKAAK